MRLTELEDMFDRILHNYQGIIFMRATPMLSSFLAVFTRGHDQLRLDER
jgi:hypothetical protein